MPTISQLPPASSTSAADQLPISQGGVARAVTVGTLFANTQQTLTLATNALLGRSSPGPGSPESIALGTGLQIQDDVLLVDHSAYPQTNALDTTSTMLLNSSAGAPQLMPISLLRGLYSAGQNISIDSNGTISSTPSPATGNNIGAVAVGDALVINASGQLSVNIGTVTGTAAAGNDDRITGAEQSVNKNQPNGYAGLDSAGIISTNQLPVFATSPVESVNGQIGNVVVNSSNIAGLGSVASQNANAVNLSGGTISGVSASAMATTPDFVTAQGRTLAAHFSDSVNVNDFGLARDGLTDDSAAFINACQTAINSNKRVYIPAGGPILLTDSAQQNLTNVCIYGDGIRDYDSPQGFGHQGSYLWLTGTANTPFLLGPNVQFHGLNFFWPNQTETATASNGGQPIIYPPLFAMQSPAQNITWFNFVDCQVTNCYDFFTATSTTSVVGGCTIERCIIYAIHDCFTLANVPEVIFIANCLFTWGVYGSVVSVGPTYNLRTFTNTEGTWLKIVGNGTTTTLSSTTVGGILSSNNYIFGSARGVWLSGGTLDISCFVDTSFDTVPSTLQGDPGCGIFSTRFTGGAWYPIYFDQTGSPDTTAIVINNPAPGGVGLNISFSGVTIPFVNGSLAAITGGNVSNVSVTDIRCNAFGHTPNGIGPYYGFQFNTPNANIRIANCDLQPNNSSLSTTGVQITACSSATISDCVFRYIRAPIDIETSTGVVTLIGNTTQATQGSSPIVGIGTGNVHDLGNSWDITQLSYNGFSPNNFRADATIGLTPVACSGTAAYVGMQPSALGSAGGTRFGVTALGSSPVSLLTNAFNEEQLRVNRVVSAVNYVAMHGSVSGSPALITTGGADTNSGLQLCGLASGATYLGSAGPSGSPTIRLGAIADQSYVVSAPGNGFTVTVPANCATLLLRPSGTLAVGTIVLPGALADGEKIAIWTSETITALTVSGTVGTTVNNGHSFQLAANSAVSFFWNAANSTWFQSLGSGLSNGSISSQNADSVVITGGSVTGLSEFSVGADAATSASMTLDCAAGYARETVYTSSSIPRWVVGVEGTPENNVSIATSASIPVGASVLPLVSTTGLATGMLVSLIGVASGTVVAAVDGTTGVQLSQPTSAPIAAGAEVFFYTDQGADYAFLPYDDTGAPLAPSIGQPLLITRATGQVTVKTLSVNGTASVPTPPAGDSSTQVATTAFVKSAITNTAVLTTSVGAQGGVAALDSGGHVPTSQLPASVQGALDYQGAWNAATNSPTLASSTGVKGQYYTVSTSGSTGLDGIVQWSQGDHAAFNGSVWEKLDGVASEVISVAGRTGAVVLAVPDISGLGSIATQPSSLVAITGGTVDATVIGASTPASGGFSALTASGAVTLSLATLTVPGFAGLQIQGGSAAPGNTRGLGAFDGQQYRAGPAQIASGQYSVQFGNGNTTSAPGSISVGGSNAVSGATGYAGAFGGNNSVSGSYAYAFGNSHTLSGAYAHAFGFRARDFGRYGIALLSSGDNTTNGDAQRSETVLRAISNAAAVRLTADGLAPGNANIVNLQNNQVAKINVEIIGFNSAGSAAASWYARDLLIGRATGPTSTTLSATTLSAGGSIGAVSGWTPPSIAADTINGGLSISSGFTSGATIKWVARIISLEVM